ETQPSAVSARQNLIGKIPQIILEVIGTIERLELAAVQCRNALACGSPQRLQSQGILAPAPLESPKAVSHGFTGILVFARLDQALDKRVQFIGQADVSGRPVGCSPGTAAYGLDLGQENWLACLSTSYRWRTPCAASCSRATGPSTS